MLLASWTSYVGTHKDDNMCGIAGFIGRSKNLHVTLQIATALFGCLEKRGTDASGFYGVETKSGKIAYYKEAIKSSQMIETNHWKNAVKHNFDLLIMHARAASTGVGSPHVNSNNHPFISEDKSIGLVHNGRVAESEYKALVQKYTTETKCDSEVILRIFENGKHADEVDVQDASHIKHRLEGLKDVWSQIVEGHMAVAVAEFLNKSERRLWLFRNEHRPLWLVDLRESLGQVFFVSTDEIWLEANKTCASIKKHIPKTKLIEIPKEEIWSLSCSEQFPTITDSSFKKYKVERTFEEIETTHNYTSGSWNGHGGEFGEEEYYGFRGMNNKKLFAQQNQQQQYSLPSNKSTTGNVVTSTKIEPPADEKKETFPHLDVATEGHPTIVHAGKEIIFACVENSQYDFYVQDVQWADGILDRDIPAPAKDASCGSLIFMESEKVWKWYVEEEIYTFPETGGSQTYKSSVKKKNLKSQQKQGQEKEIDEEIDKATFFGLTEDEVESIECVVESTDQLDFANKVSIRCNEIGNMMTGLISQIDLVPEESIGSAIDSIGVVCKKINSLLEDIKVLACNKAAESGFDRDSEKQLLIELVDIKKDAKTIMSMILDDPDQALEGFEQIAKELEGTLFQLK